MKRTLVLILAAAALCACSSASKATYAEFDDPETRLIKPSDEVDIGFGHIKKDQVTTSVTDVDINREEIETYANIWDYLRGRVPGVQIGNSTSGETPEITVRGINSITLSSQPLIMVDGMEMADISFLNPYEVSSVSVIKDGSAAMYGVRGANGVILITTKAAAMAAQQAEEAHKAAKEAAKLARKAKRNK